MSKSYSKKLRKRGVEKNRRPTPEKNFNLLALKPSGLPAKVTYNFGPKLTLLPKPAPKLNVLLVSIKHSKPHSKHLHGGRMAKQYRHERRAMPAKVKLPMVQQPIISDSEWCAFPPFPNRKPIPYRALTSTGHIEVPRTEAQAIRLEAGASLAKSLRSKVALTSGKTFGHAAAV